MFAEMLASESLKLPLKNLSAFSPNSLTACLLHLSLYLTKFIYNDTIFSNNVHAGTNRTDNGTQAIRAMEMSIK